MPLSKTYEKILMQQSLPQAKIRIYLYFQNLPVVHEVELLII